MASGRIWTRCVSITHQLRAVLGADGGDGSKQIARLRRLVGEHDASREEVHEAAEGEQTSWTRLYGTSSAKSSNLGCVADGVDETRGVAGVEYGKNLVIVHRSTLSTTRPG